MHIWDLDAVLALQHLRWGPLTAVMQVASAWWFKSLVLIGVGLAADLAGRDRLPRAAVTGLAAYVTASVAAHALKDLVDRPRPPLADARVLVETPLPSSSSMPSAHAATAFAVAVAVGTLHPRLRVALLAAATLVGVSRVYLGVHFPTDVLAGAALGVAAGLAWGSVARRVSTPTWTPAGRPEVPAE